MKFLCKKPQNKLNLEVFFSKFVGKEAYFAHKKNTKIPSPLCFDPPKNITPQIACIFYKKTKKVKNLLKYPNKLILKNTELILKSNHVLFFLLLFLAFLFLINIFRLFPF